MPVAQTLALAINNADRNMMHKSRERKAILKWRNDRRNSVEEDRAIETMAIERMADTGWSCGRKNKIARKGQSK